MLRLRRKRQKATARLTNFINKQTREDSCETFAIARVEVPPTNLLKNEQLNAVTATNNEENIQQNTSGKPQKDILVDSSFLHKKSSEALKTNHKTLSDDENFSFTKNLSISYLHPNSAYSQNFGWLNLDLEVDIINEPCLTKFYAPYIINNLIKLTACESGAVRPKQIQHSIVYEINKSNEQWNFLNLVNLNKLNAYLRITQQIILHHMDHAYFDLCFWWFIPFPRRDNCRVPRDPNKPHIKKLWLDFSITAINSNTTPVTLHHIATYFKEYPSPFVIIALDLLVFIFPCTSIFYNGFICFFPFFLPLFLYFIFFFISFFFCSCFFFSFFIFASALSL